MAHSSIALDWSNQRSDIELELISVLKSIQFKNSKRSSAFLQYVVEQAMDGNSQHLKERTIGATVFGRSGDYDTSNDAFVRVRANDVRRRLAAYYESNESRGGVRIELETGTYVPQFKSIAAPPERDPGIVLPRWKVAIGLLMTVLFGRDAVIQRLSAVLQESQSE